MQLNRYDAFFVNDPAFFQAFEQKLNTFWLLPDKFGS